jgi:hypothetical protein
METSGLEEIGADTIQEHIFDLFVERKNENPEGLGWLSRDSEVQVTIADKYDLSIKQSLSLLNSKKESSTTGAVAWRVSPRFCEWVLDENSLFHDLLSSPHSIVVELGAGVAGIVASVIGPRVGRYIATDQSHLLKLLRTNIENNLVSSVHSAAHYSGRKGRGRPKHEHKSALPTSHVLVEEFDWENLDTIGYFENDIRGVGCNGIILACDTIYNDYLIPHFCAAVKLVLSTMGSGSRLIMAQQLRSEEVLESCLVALSGAGLCVYSVESAQLSAELSNGFAVHLTMLRC